MASKAGVFCYRAAVDPELVFKIINTLPMPIWLVWVLAPKSKISRFFCDALWPWAVLAGVYATLIVVAMTSGEGGGDLSSLAGLMEAFSSEWAVLAGWAHYLCFDLFVARWIMRDAPEGGYKLSPILILTLMVGPVGLLVYTLLRSWIGGGAESGDAKLSAAA